MPSNKTNKPQPANKTSKPFQIAQTAAIWPQLKLTPLLGRHLPMCLLVQLVLLPRKNKILLQYLIKKLQMHLKSPILTMTQIKFPLPLHLVITRLLCTTKAILELEAYSQTESDQQPVTVIPCTALKLAASDPQTQVPATLVVILTQTLTQAVLVELVQDRQLATVLKLTQASINFNCRCLIWNKPFTQIS